MPTKTRDIAFLLKNYNKKYQTAFTLNSEIQKAVFLYEVGRLSNHEVRVNFVQSRNAFLSMQKFTQHYINPVGATNINCKHFLSYIDTLDYKKDSSLRLEIWPNTKIRYAYLEDNYAALGVGTLGKSCMRYKSMQKALNFYIKNDVQIVVVVDTKSKIHARALLWHNVKEIGKKPSFTYLDRIYYKNSYLESQFYDLATKNDWRARGHHSTSNFYRENLNIKEMCHFPYTDTFRYLYYKDNVITAGSYPTSIKNKRCQISLSNTSNGGYFPQLDPNKVTEVLSDSYISKKDGIFVKRYNGWVHKNNIVDMNGAYYSRFDNNLKQTEKDGWILIVDLVQEVITSDNISKENAVFVEKYNGYIHNTNLLTIKGDKYHKQDKQVVRHNNKWYHISDCFINLNREEYNKEISAGARQKYMEWTGSLVPYARITPKGDLIPKEVASIAYDLFYNPIIDKIEFQEVYLINGENTIPLVSGELIVDSDNNRQYTKKFNGKYYLKRDFQIPDKNQLALF